MERCAYQDRSVLKNVVESKTFDLAPTWENYFNLTEVGEGLGLPRSPDNYDWMTLLFIREQGYPEDGLIDEYPDEFSFYDKFEEIEKKLLGPDRLNVRNEMQEKAKRLAGDLLNEHFPNMRQDEVSREIKVKDSIMVSKNKGIRM